MYHVCLYGIADNAWSTDVRRRYDYVRWSVEENPDEVCRAGEPDKGREAHQNVKEFLELVYFAHDAFAPDCSDMVVLSLATRDSWNHSIDLPMVAATI